MSQHRITLKWNRTTPDFEYKTYNRDHAVTFKNGVTLSMSAAVAYKGDAALVDPEEAFVASLSSCHMLTFLALATRQQIVVDRYEDDAVGFLEKNEQRKLAITRVILRPRISFGDNTAPDDATLASLHDAAHHACFIANSVTTAVTIESPQTASSGAALATDV